MFILFIAFTPKKTDTGLEPDGRLDGSVGMTVMTRWISGITYMLDAQRVEEEIRCWNYDIIAFYTSSRIWPHFHLIWPHLAS